MDAGFSGPGIGGMPVIKTGLVTPAANGVTTVFTIAHGLGSTPGYFNAVAGNALSSAGFYMTADATNITITYLLAPTTGTLSLKWMVIA